MIPGNPVGNRLEREADRGSTPVASGGDAQRPLRVLRARLDRRDALVWENLPREWSRARLWGFLALSALCGAVIAGLEGDPPPSPPMRLAIWLAVAAALLLAAALAMTIRHHLRASARFPDPVDMMVEVWGDHLAVSQGGHLFHIAPETISAVVVPGTPASHLFISAPPELAVIPLAAFEDEADLRALADHWDRLSHDAVP